ncbi:zf-HC2 domain-containing protein [Rubinisphaera sp. JC750]|uniref:zf-HC2 domain-containing protein n=1 Tax=Rubinisphaera sp. JC750 TaxID=2898658 RepID=UPI001F29745A|nr:zf-HC2 domain-containing protein [Rubinisphaera sp. JC750]
MSDNIVSGESFSEEDWPMTGDTPQHDLEGRDTAVSQGDHAQGWQDCRGGEIAACVRGVVSRRQAARRSRIVQSTITVAGLLVVLGMGSLWMIPPQAAVAEACCKDVHDMAEQYVHHELDAETTARIERHLEGCQRCQQHIHSLTEQLNHALSWLWPLPELERALPSGDSKVEPALVVQSRTHTG